MRGIYKYTNKINQKSYIGQSVYLERRKADHKYRYNKPEIYKHESTKFYAALRKYGYENFEYEVLEASNDFTQEELNEKEKYYIKLYDSIKNGYNIEAGGQDGVSFSKVTEEQVLEIKYLIRDTDMNIEEIGKKYGLAIAAISRINTGNAWALVGDFTYPLRKTKHQKRIERLEADAQVKAKQSLQKLYDIIEINEYYINHTIYETVAHFKDKYKKSAIEHICYGNACNYLEFKTFTIKTPYYKKKEGQWYIGNTLIDYLQWKSKVFSDIALEMDRTEEISDTRNSQST